MESSPLAAIATVASTWRLAMRVGSLAIETGISMDCSSSGTVMLD